MKREPLNRLSNWIYKLARIGEVFSWFGMAVLPMGAAFLIVNRNRLGELEQEGWHFNITGVTERNILREGHLDVLSLVLYCLMMMAVCIAMAMVLHQLCTVIRRIGNGTPFRRDVLGPIRQIGYFCMAIPIARFVFSIITSLILDRTHTVINLTDIFIALVVLWVTRMYAYGVELQDDVEGLL